MGRQKVSVVGAGNVGGSVAQRLAEKNCYDIVLVDIVDGLPQGKALDLSEASPICGHDSKIVGTTGYDATVDSSLAVITSGIPRKPGMSRDELLETNTQIVQSVVHEIAQRSPTAIIVVVSNPLDAMTYVALRVSGFPKQRVVGMAGVLDTARMRFFIAEALGVSVQAVHAIVLGGHGDSMVPLVRYTTVAGRPIEGLMPKNTLDALVQRTRDGGAEVLKLLKSGSAFYAPSAAVLETVDAILMDQKKILPCAALCEGQYGLDGVIMGVPVRLGAAGVDEIVEYDLTPEEQVAVEQSAADVRRLCADADRFLVELSPIS